MGCAMVRRIFMQPARGAIIRHLFCGWIFSRSRFPLSNTSFRKNRVKLGKAGGQEKGGRSKSSPPLAFVSNQDAGHRAEGQIIAFWFPP